MPYKSVEGTHHCHKGAKTEVFWSRSMRNPALLSANNKGADQSAQMQILISTLQYAIQLVSLTCAC